MDHKPLGPDGPKPIEGDNCTCIRCGDARPFGGNGFPHTHDKPNKELCVDQRTDGEILGMHKLTGKVVGAFVTNEELLSK